MKRVAVVPGTKYFSALQQLIRRLDRKNVKASAQIDDELVTFEIDWEDETDNVCGIECFVERVNK